MSRLLSTGDSDQLVRRKAELDGFEKAARLIERLTTESNIE